MGVESWIGPEQPAPSLSSSHRWWGQHSWRGAVPSPKSRCSIVRKRKQEPDPLTPIKAVSVGHNLLGQVKPLEEAGAGSHDLDSGCCHTLLVLAGLIGGLQEHLSVVGRPEEAKAPDHTWQSKPSSSWCGRVSGIGLGSLSFPSIDITATLATAEPLALPPPRG